MHIPSDLGWNATYEDYCSEALISAIYMKDEADEVIVKHLVGKGDEGWDLDINEAIRLVKKLRSKQW